MPNIVSDHGFTIRTGMPHVVDDGSRLDGDHHSAHAAKAVFVSSPKLYPPFVAQPPHQHHESTSTSASDSASSSPTTVPSLADDSSVTEMSPGSSPESPMAKQSISLGTEIVRQELTFVSPSTTSFFELQRPATPIKRPRNLKNLAVNTTGSSGMATKPRPLMTAESTDTTVAEPVEPPRPRPLSFRRPPSPPIRKLSKVALTIVTPANTLATTEAEGNVVPPTPSLMRPPALRHIQSSPSLPMSVSYQGPPVSWRPILERAQSDMVSRADDEEMNFDVPPSREDKPEAYPDGPICVFEPYIDLYLEPSVEQALTYDVILNVASEVRNPFSQQQQELEEQDEIRLDGGGGIQYAPGRSRKSALANDTVTLAPSLDISTPTTPKATPLTKTLVSDIGGAAKQPEYIHIPWEHNTDIVYDLVRLVKLIDERVRQGKRLLIHCQCGVSRSATLVVAYCMYVHPEYSVQQAYDVIKRRSKWIGPNMNLIMQLQEFSSHIGVGSSRRTLGHPGFRAFAPVETSNSWQNWRSGPADYDERIAENVPKTAPLPPPQRYSSAVDTITPGPSSAPPGGSWPFTDDAPVQTSPDRKEGRALSVPAAPSLLHEPLNPSGGNRRFSERTLRPQSIRFDSDSIATIQETSVPTISPRGEEFAMVSVLPSAALAPEDHFGIMSPTTSTFQHAPLDRDALLGSMGMAASAQDGRRRTQNFSLPFRKSYIPPPSPTELDATPSDAANEEEQTLTELPANAESLMSPSAASFPAHLHVDPLDPERNPSVELRKTGRDPRSPAQMGCDQITRNIADAF